MVTGGVKSNITRVDRSIKPGSLWEGFEEQYAHRQVYSQTVGQDTSKYARTVVNGVITCRGWLWNSNEIWAGGGISSVKFGIFMDRWLPGGIWGPAMSRINHIQGAGKKKSA